jgi:hypothetical protein
LGSYLLFLLLSAFPSFSSAPQDLVRDAMRLRDRGQFARAVDLLEDRLRQDPDDAEAARLRAETLYWLKEFERARSAYMAALERHPGNERLRLEYARMLSETGERGAARKVLDPLVRGSQPSAGAQTLLGTILYWDGDLTRAKQLFEEALRIDPAQADAARQLREIRHLSSAWLRFAPVVWHDDQPLDRTGIAVEAGWFFTPLLSMMVRSEPSRHSAGAAQTFWASEVEVSHVAPRARLETRLAAGVFRRPGDHDGQTWTGRAAGAIRVGAGVTVLGRIERTPYLSTVASLETPVVTRTLSGLLQVSRASGWLGEAAIQRQVFPDENAVRTAYAWLLAPVARGAAGRLQAGYAFAAADAGEDRFVLARPQQPLPPADPRFDLTGVYRPYYTPARSVTHSVIAALTAEQSSGPVVRASGSYGFRAREDATSFHTLGNQIFSSVGRRAYTPWTARGSLEIPVSRSVRLSVVGETGRTAYYRWTTAGVQILCRFLPPDPAGAQDQ